MNNGYALLIGLNQVNPIHYGGWDGSLSQPETDANEISMLTASAHFKTKILLSKEATRENCIGMIESYTEKLEKDDMLFIYYSGHGGQVKDLSGDEDDGLDETWCLYDGQLIDDELRLLLTKFRKGVRILVISDSCHSGTITKALPWEETNIIEKALPQEYILKTFKLNESFYTEIANKLIEMGADDMEVIASVIQISACQDYESALALNIDSCSAFTTELLKWTNNKVINYEELYHNIDISLNEKLKSVWRHQSPKLFITGEPDSLFLHKNFLEL